MGIFKILVIFLVVYMVIALIFRYFITIKKLNPSKLSRLFYEDDERFIKSWEKIKEKGMLKLVLKNTIIMTFMMSIIGIVFIFNKRSMYGEVQSQTLLTDLLMGVILGVLNSLMQCFFGNDRYNILKEKGKVESANVNNTNKKL
jgi:uncharacterized ion transporter superfamily protein YfcC